jgi:hypothetical protein
MESVYIILGLVAAAVIGYLVFKAEQKRRDGLRRVATHFGLSFDPGQDTAHHRQYGHGVFHRGRRRVASKTMHGPLELAGRSCYVKMGDYRYTTGSGKNARTHRMSYAVIHLPWIGTPDFLIRKEHIGDKLGSGLGFDDIDFESEEFSRRFWVKSTDRKFAYDVIHPGMMEFLLDGPKPHVEIVSDACLILDGQTRWDPDQFVNCMRWADAFLGRWPEHLTTRLHLRGGQSA